MYGCSELYSFQIPWRRCSSSLENKFVRVSDIDGAYKRALMKVNPSIRETSIMSTTKWANNSAMHASSIPSECSVGRVRDPNPLHFATDCRSEMFFHSWSILYCVNGDVSTDKRDRTCPAPWQPPWCLGCSNLTDVLYKAHTPRQESMTIHALHSIAWQESTYLFSWVKYKHNMPCVSTLQDVIPVGMVYWSWRIHVQ